MWIRPSSLYQRHSCGWILCYSNTGFHQRSNWSMLFMHKNKNSIERGLHTKKDSQDTLWTRWSCRTCSRHRTYVYSYSWLNKFFPHTRWKYCFKGYIHQSHTVHSIQRPHLNTIQFMRTLEILQSMKGQFTTLISIITQHIIQPIGAISGTPSRSTNRYWQEFHRKEKFTTISQYRSISSNS